MPFGTPRRDRSSAVAGTAAGVPVRARARGVPAGVPCVPVPDGASPAWRARGAVVPGPPAVAVGAQLLRAAGWHLPCVTSRAVSAFAGWTPHPPAAHVTTSVWAAGAVRAGPERRCVRPVRDRARARIRRPEGTRSRWWSGGRPPLRRGEAVEGARPHGVGGLRAVQTTRRAATRTKDHTELLWGSRLTPCHPRTACSPYAALTPPRRRGSAPRPRSARPARTTVSGAGRAERERAGPRGRPRPSTGLRGGGVRPSPAGAA